MATRRLWGVLRGCVGAAAIAVVLVGCSDREELSRLEAEKASLARQVEALTKELAAFRKLGQSAGDLAEALRRLEQADDVVAGLRREIDGLATDLAMRIGQLLSKESEIGGLMQRLEQNIGEIAGLRLRMGSLESELSGVQMQLTTFQQLADERLKALTEATKQIELLTNALRGTGGGGLERLLPNLLPGQKKDPPSTSPPSGG
ncbi:MAG: hypothetical protein KF866_11175 [Phycisphaeraceae bacterium]|nr:hypothetical protein [Phycisphaeraceae bacterium]